MQFDPQRPQLRHAGTPGSRVQSIVVRVLTALAAAVALVGAIAMSLVVFAIALTALCVFGLYFWWKLRQLRRQAPSRPRQDDVIEGVVVRRESTRE